jgi:hypothetical protein
VITRIFDIREAKARSDRDGSEAKDDDDNLLDNEQEEPVPLEVAHIIPHSLLQANAGGNELVCAT